MSGKRRKVEPIPSLTPIRYDHIDLSSHLATSMYPDRVSSSYMFSPFDMSSRGFTPGGMVSGIAGAMIGGAGNLIGGLMENFAQERFYNQYQSPQAQMRQMVEAGINPNLAAQGISGSGPAQFNAAAMSGMGNAAAAGAQAGASAYNADTQKRLSDAQVKAAEAQAESMEMDTALKSVELGFKPSMQSAQLNLTRKQVDEVVQRIKESTSLVEKYGKEMQQIDKNIDLMNSEIGVNEVEKKEISARAAYENSMKQLNEQLKQLNDNDLANRYAKACAEGRFDDAEKILNEMYDKVNAESRGAYEADPIHRQFNTLYDAIGTVDKAVNQFAEKLAWFETDYALGKLDMTEDEYKRTRQELKDTLEELKTQKKNVSKAFDKASYKNGYHTEWQDKSNIIIDRGMQIIGNIASAAIVGKGLGAGKKVIDRNPIEVVPANTNVTNGASYVYH